MADPQELIGQRFGDYQLTRLIGQGAYGAVYQARHLDDSSQAAVKVLNLQMTSPDNVRAFLNEARTIRLQHPHIVPVLDFGLSRRGNLPFLVMEYAAGGTVRDHYPKGTKLPLPIIDEYVQAIASALQYAHDRRIIHRDVKPENMLMHSNGTVQLSDFGIARLVEQNTISTSQRSPVGTPAYMAPEQAQGRACLASDQYALAIIVYEWIAGQRPFQGNHLEIMMQHQLNPPPPLRSLRPEIPRRIEHILFKALAKKPEDRFSTVEEFAQELHEAIQEAIDATDLTERPANYATMPVSTDSSETLPPWTNLPEEAFPPLDAPAGRSSSIDDKLPNSQSSSLSTIRRSSAGSGPRMPTAFKRPTPRSTRKKIWIYLVAGATILVLATIVYGIVFTSHGSPQLIWGADPVSIKGTEPSTPTPTPQATQMSTPTPQPTQTSTLTSQPTPTPQSARTPNEIYQQYTAGTPTKTDARLDGGAWPWFNATPPFGDCTFTQGAYHAQPHKGTFAACVASNDQYTTFAFQMQVSIQSGDAAGLIVDYQPTTPYRTFDGFLFCRDAGAKNECQPGGVWFTHAEHGGAGCMASAQFNCDRTYPFVNTAPGAQNTLTIIALSHSIYLYINGQSVGVVPRTSIQAGGIGVTAYEETNPTDVTFQNAKLWVLSGV